jgi:hypothetical protein
MTQVFDYNLNQKFILGDSTRHFYSYGGEISNNSFINPSGTPALIETFFSPDTSQLQVYGSDTQYHLATLQIDADGNVSYSQNPTTIPAQQLLNNGLKQQILSNRATVLIYSPYGWSSNNGVGSPNTSVLYLVWASAIILTWA